MTPNNYYILGMALMHGGLIFSLLKLWGELRQPGWRIAAYVACAVFLASRIPTIYLLLPSLWWPGALGQIVDEAALCLWATMVAMVVSIIPRKLKLGATGFPV
jgi:hypothetical protein